MEEWVEKIMKDADKKIKEKFDAAAKEGLRTTLDDETWNKVMKKECNCIHHIKHVDNPNEHLFYKGLGTENQTYLFKVVFNEPKVYKGGGFDESFECSFTVDYSRYPKHVNLKIGKS